MLCIYVAKCFHILPTKWAILHLQYLIIYSLVEFFLFDNSNNNLISPSRELIFCSVHESPFQTEWSSRELQSTPYQMHAAYSFFYVWAHSGASSSSPGESQFRNRFYIWGPGTAKAEHIREAIFLFSKSPLLSNPLADICCLLEEAVFKPSCLGGTYAGRWRKSNEGKWSKEYSPFRFADSQQVNIAAVAVKQKKTSKQLLSWKSFI